MKKLLFILCISFTFNASAQILWGAGSSNSSYDEAGRFAVAFGSPNGWTANGVSSPTALWTRTTNGLTQGAYATGQQAIGSPSESDGAALYDSDFLDNNGVQGAFGTGTCPSPHKGELVSPSFDLTGYTDAVIMAKVFLYYRNFSINELSVGLSTDGGASWNDFSIDQNVAVNTTFNPAFITVPLSYVLNGIANLTDCKLRLTFDGDYYFAMIDDISIELFNADPDMAIASQDIIYDYKTTASPAPYKTMPLQIAKTYTPYNYAALVINNGATDIPLTSNPIVNYDLSKNVSGTWTSVLNADVAITNPILANDTVSVSGDITTQMQAAFNTNGTGDYRFMYVVHHDLSDLTLSNDTAFHYFTISPDYSWYSASPLLADGGPASTNSAFPASGPGNVIQELEWGGLYYFPDTANIAIDSVKYRMKVPANFNLTNQEIPLTINVSEWIDVNTDQVLDYNSGELVLKTFVQDTLAINASNLNSYILGKVKIVDPNLLNTTTLQYDIPYALTNGSSPDALYYISVSQTNNAGLIAANGDINCIFPAVNEMPYEWSYEFTNNVLTPLKVTEGVPNGAGFTNWYNGFSGQYSAPSTALSIIDFSTYFNTSGIKEMNSTIDVNAYPNPTSNAITVEFDSQKESSLVRYILTDASGRVLFMETHKHIQQETFTIDLTKLPAGSYFIHVKSDEGTITKPIVKK